ncbi:myelin-associated glycoprotein isoform X1 [Danio rerio]|uniref:Myelin-associated glycoprotein n=3 Tax=Danio rerio TaxID=7955 RepID=A0A8M1QUS3_DANRE|nr:B-cell receptor CD22-like [Danio rerio]|eukprot:XP_001920051.2 B-cell receptor CD22-like [Danio rerio]
MAGNQIGSFIFISSLLLHTQLADVQYSAVMPHTVTALTGSCVQIPCTFNTSDFEDKLKKTVKSFYGLWLKKIPQYGNTDSFIAFNSSNNIIRGFSDIQITGNLSERNCTTVFYNIMMNHSDNYYFRLETKPEVFKATFNNQPVRISVRDFPQQPELKPNNLPYVMEESTVNLNCSAEAPCPKQPPNVSWSNIPESASITTQLLEKPDKTQSVFSLMTFKASYRDHKKNIYCTVTYTRETANDSTVETNVTLLVLFPPKETHITISPSASVSVGTNVTLTCKSKGSPSNNMTYTWYKLGKDTAIAREKKITFTVSQNDTGFYLCTAQNKHGNQSSRPKNIQLTSEESSRLVIYGCTKGIFTLILLSAVCFYYLRIKTSGQAHDTGSNQAMDKNSDAVAIYANNGFVISEKNEKETADLHYGEIDFSKLQTSHATREFLSNEPPTEYAELQVTEKKTKINK